MEEVGDWSEWTSCPATCGFGVFETRTRSCGDEDSCESVEIMACTDDLVYYQLLLKVSMKVTEMPLRSYY